MSFLDFPELQKIKSLDSDEAFPMGFVIVPRDIELANIRTKLFRQGIPTGTETLQIRICADAAGTKVIYLSNVLDVSDFSGDPNFIGKVRFDFAPAVPLSADHTYYFYGVAANYTRNGDVFYLGFGLEDDPDKTNDIDQTRPPIHMELYEVFYGG